MATRSVRALLAVCLSLAAFLFVRPGCLVASPQAPAPAARPAAPPAGPERVTSVEGITEYRLSNGLRVLLFPDLSKQMVTVNMTYLVGSRHENYGETGMAHLLEHMMFKGSTKHPNVPQELTDHGSSANGTTWFDRTNYYETVKATDANVTWALQLEADRMVNSFIAKKDLDSEFTVVRNEMESDENSPERILNQRVHSAAFDWHNYGKDTIGDRADVENVPIDRLKAFYKLYYQPDNAVLMVSGKFDEPKVLAQVAAIFGVIPKPARKLPPMYTVEPTQDGERSVTLRRVGDIQLVAAAYHVPSGAHADFAAIDMLTEILGDEPSGRLYKALVETKKATDVWTFDDATFDPGLMIAGALVAKDGSLDDARAAVLEVLDGFAKTPVTKEEVDRARVRMLKDVDLELAASDEIGLDMSEYVAQGDWRLFFLRRDRIRQLTAADVNRVAATYLKPSNRTVGLFIPTPAPDRAEIPKRPDIAAMLKGYTGDAPVAPGEAFDPTPSNIELRTTRSATAGGLKLALLPRKTRGAIVEANLAFHIGNEKDLMNRGVAGTVAGEMLMRGTTAHTRQQIEDEFDRLKANVFVGGGSESATGYIQTTRENFPLVLKLVAEILRSPSFPQDEFDRIKQEALTNLESSRQQPGPVAQRALNRHLDPYPVGHPRHVETLDEQIAAYKALTLDDVKKFYADFYGGDKGELAIVGDFDDKAVLALADQLFGGWKNKLPFVRIPNLSANAAPIDEAIQTPDKANAYFAAALPLTLQQSDPDYAALLLGDYMFGGGFLSSRFPQRVRQKDGLSYGAGSSVSAPWFDKAGAFRAYAIAAPENMAKVEADFKEELARVLKDGFTAAELAAAKAGWLQEREVDRASGFTDTLQTYLFQGRTFTWDADLEEKVHALTPEAVLAVMRKYIDPDKVSIVKAGDFKKDK